MEIKTRKKCGVCKAELLTVLNLGKLPLANHLLTKEELSKKEKIYPLTLCFCETCGLVQLGQIVSPRVMYTDYLYIPSMSRTLVNHFEELCESVLKIKNGENFVVDIGSNDGTLLKFFKLSGNQILGVDPAIHIAEAATESGVPTLPVIFNSQMAKQIVKKYGLAHVVTATNVFAHVEDLFDLYRGIDILLKDDGICVFEVSNLFDMIKNSLFDSIYHEHLYYFSVSTLLKLFEKTNFEIFNVDHIPMHGGSLRVWLKKKNNRKIKIQHATISKFVKLEKQFGLFKIKCYEKFAKNIFNFKKQLKIKLADLKKERKHIVAFGAPAKGNVLLNFFGIGKETIDYIVDSTSYKQFRFAPGNHLQILPEETIYIDKPDYLLILAWNFSEEIMKKHADFKNRFIIPLPQLKIC